MRKQNPLVCTCVRLGYGGGEPVRSAEKQDQVADDLASALDPVRILLHMKPLPYN